MRKPPGERGVAMTGEAQHGEVIDGHDEGASICPRHVEVREMYEVRSEVGQLLAEYYLLGPTVRPKVCDLSDEVSPGWLPSLSIGLSNQDDVFGHFVKLRKFPEESIGVPRSE